MTLAPFTTSRTIQLSLWVIVSAVLGVVFFYFSLLDSWQEKILDRFFLKKTASQEIVIVSIDEESITRIGQWPWPRKTFAELLPVLAPAGTIGFDINFSEPSRYGAEDDAMLTRALADFDSRVVLPVELDRRGDIVSEPLPQFKAVSRQGFANVALDYDGIARRAISQAGGIQSFARALVRDDFPAPREFRVDWRGPEKSFLTIPFSDVLENKIPARIFQGKMVLVGATTPSLHDVVATPFGTIPGVEFHTNAISTILDQRFFQEPSMVLGFSTIFAVALLLGIAALTIKKFSLLVVAFIGTFIAILLLSITLFSYYYILPALYMGITHLVAVFSIVGFQYAHESKEKRFIRSTFQYYLSPAVIEEMVKDPRRVTLGGEARAITVLFSDIRGFTSIAEALSPIQLTALLNEYLTAMTDIIMERRGVVDKYIGDAVMAFWGAPLANPRQARDACDSAIEMLRTLDRLNRVWQEKGIPTMKIGIGINYGTMVVGNMGSAKRFNYTLMGDEVNFCSRLEGLTKYYGVPCLINESVKKEIDGFAHLAVRELDVVKVKGKREPRRIFELVSHPRDARSKKIAEFFASGRESYMHGEWDKAIIDFESALAIGDDGPSRALLERTRELQKDSPLHWDGIYEFTSK